MASVVDICNLALGHLGDDATVASIDPPEGSAQAEHCARFYAIARETLLEAHAWNFATRRAQLAQVTSLWPEWSYCYSRPTDALKVLAVLPVDAADDYGVSYGGSTFDGLPTSAFPTTVAYTPQDFSCETDSNGNEVIYTDLEDATLRYIVRVTDPTKFSPLFVMTLSWQLAALLAGPVLKGDAGAAEAKRCLQMVEMYLSRAAVSDANQRQITPRHNVSWMTGR